MKHNCLNILKALVITCFLLSTNILGAQNNSNTTTNSKPKLNKFGLGIKLNHLYDVKFTAYDKLSNGYLGEDANGLNGSKTKFDLAFGLDLIYFISPLVSIDASYDKGTMTAANRLNYYESDVDFLTLGLNYSLKGRNRNKPHKLVPFLRASIASANYDTKLKFIDDDRIFNTEKGTAMQVGLGLGLRYHLNKNWHINLQSEFITTYTDAWDGYNYGSGKDHMAKTSIGLRYTFGKKPHQDMAAAWQFGGGNSSFIDNNYDKEIAKLRDSMAFEKQKLIAANNNILELRNMVTKDTDGDGVPDIKDYCPNEAANTKDGCPIGTTPVPVASTVTPANNNNNNNNVNPASITEIAQLLQLELNKIYFELSSKTINSESKRILNKSIEVLKKHPNLKINVLGYADYVGNTESNMALSEARAKAVADYLTKNGIEPSRVNIKPMGSQSKLPRNNYLNRRVEFEIVE
ncbi:MAG: OmpA family protein [Bacteroidia bacterium]|nr:OmpA family protein [Bacteroidia bacterium]